MGDPKGVSAYVTVAVSSEANIQLIRVVVDCRQEASDPDDGFLRVGQGITSSPLRDHRSLPA